MINYQDNEVDNLYTEGFVLAQTSPLSLQMEAGTLNSIGEKKVPKLQKVTVEGVEKEREIMETETTVSTLEYPSFQLDVEPDDELPVVYDVYLLEENSEEGYNIHIDRTEMLAGAIPFYEGDAPLIHCLLSFLVPPNLKDLSEIPLDVRNIVLKEKGE